MMIGLSFGLMVATLSLAAWVAKRSGWRLTLALFVMAFGVMCVNPLIEAVVFGVMPPADVPPIVALQLMLALVMSLVATVVSGKWRNDRSPAIAPRFTPLRLVAVAACYVILYEAAGIAVFPFVKEFYATKTLPPLALLVPLQLVRGVLYVVFAWPWLRLAPRWVGPVLGLIYAVVGGVAPLLVENPYMPREVRLPHSVEVGISNFIFGLAAGWLVGTPPKPASGLPGRGAG